MTTAKKNKRDTLSAWLMLSPFLIFFILFVLYPIIMNFYYSFTNYNLFKAPNFIGLKNYEKLLKDEVFHKAIYNTTVYALISIIGLTVLGLLAATALNRKIRGIKAIRMLFIFPYATSMTAVSLIWLMMFDPLSGFLNKALITLNLPPSNWLFDKNISLWCLIFVNVWKNMGYCMLIFLAGMSSIPIDIYEAAVIDGASDRQKLWNITIPMLKPVTFFVLVTTTLESFKTFEQVLIMTRGDPLNATTTIVHQIYLRGFSEFKMGYASAMTVVLFIIVFSITLLNFRFGAGKER